MQQEQAKVEVGKKQVEKLTVSLRVVRKCSILLIKKKRVRSVRNINIV